MGGKPVLEGEVALEATGPWILHWASMSHDASVRRAALVPLGAACLVGSLPWELKLSWTDLPRAWGAWPPEVAVASRSPQSMHPLTASCWW